MLVGTLLVGAVVFYFLYTWIFGHWDRRNVFNVKWKFTFDTFVHVVLKKKHIQHLFYDFYEKYKKEGLIGFYSIFSPMLLVTDPELVKTVIVRDFNKFVDTGMKVSEKTDPLFSKNPFVAKGMEQWKELRGIQASLQTTLKFKEMIPMIFTVAENMVNYLEEKKLEPVCVKKMTFMYTVDNACSCGFGIEPSAFTDPENNFIKYANIEKLFSSSPLSLVIHFFSPEIANFLRLRLSSEDAEGFFKTLVQRIIDHRTQAKISKNDLFDHIIKLNQKRLEENKSAYSNIEMAGHCLTFFVDSTETTSNQLGFFLLDLANHPEVQEKLRKEISSVGKSPTDFDLEKIHSINYLNMALNENLRLHPQGGWLSRICTEDTVLGNVHVSKGIRVFIPIASFHSDPEYFPDPGKYDPERFSEENKNSIEKFTFLPFGEGPRICVGNKFALLQIKLAVIFLLLNFTILPSTDGNKENIVLDNTPFLAPGPETKLRFKPLSHNF